MFTGKFEQFELEIIVELKVYLLSIVYCKQIYKTTIKRAARSNRYKKARDFEKPNKGNRKDFWRHYTTRNQSENTNVPIQDFKSHFQYMFDTVQHNLNEDAEHFNESNDFDRTDPIYEELDTPIIVKFVKL